MITITISESEHNTKQEVGIQRIFPKTKLVSEDQVCHYNYGLLEDGKIEVAGRVKHKPEDGVFLLVESAMKNLKSKEKKDSLYSIFD